MRLREAVPVVHAVSQAPSLASLVQLAQASSECLRLVTPLMPPALRSGVQAGPLQDGQWCLLAANSAVAAKLRQMLPALAAHLRAKGHDVQEIRIKVAMRSGA
ncbi:MAG: DciA family protein [Brachymonas sp.]